MKLTTKIFDTLTDGQKQSIVDYLNELELDDADNSIRNAKRCLEGQGYLELQNMVADYYHRAGVNHTKNELREILGFDRMMTDKEKQQLEYAIKHPMGSRIAWDCPELEPHEFEIVEGSAKLIPLGDDGSTTVVIGTKDRKKALRMIRRYERDWVDDGDLSEDRDIEERLLVWRKAEFDHESDSTHMFSWSKKDTKNNPKAVHAFLREA